MPPRVILVATDFGTPAHRAIELATELAANVDARVMLVHVVEPVPSGYYPSPAWVQGVRKEAHRTLEVEAAAVKRRLPQTDAVLLEGYCSEEILAEATKHHADLIVMGRHGRRGLPRLLLGSVAEKVARMSEVPVLTVP